MQGAVKLREFSIRVRHPDPNHADKIFFHLHVKCVACRLSWTFLTAYRFPKTYPTLACPIFTIERPMRGIADEQYTKLNRVLHAEAQANKGTEMVFQVRRTDFGYGLTTARSFPRPCRRYVHPLSLRRDHPKQHRASEGSLV